MQCNRNKWSCESPSKRFQFSFSKTNILYMGSSGCFGVWKGRGPRSEKFTPMTRHNIYWDIPNSKPSQLGLSRYHPWKNRSNSNWHLHHITSRLTLQSTHYITGYTLHHDLHDRQKRSRLATIEREISFEVIVGVQFLSITRVTWSEVDWLVCSAGSSVVYSEFLMSRIERSSAMCHLISRDKRSKDLSRKKVV